MDYVDNVNMDAKFSLVAKNIRTIGEAKIDLNGVTVLAGENGSGKTTIARLLYSFVRTSVDFDSIISDMLDSEAGAVIDFLDEFVSPTTRRNLGSLDQDSFMQQSLSKKLTTALELLDYMQSKYVSGELKLSRARLARLNSIYKGYINKTSSKDFVSPEALLVDCAQYLKRRVSIIKMLQATHSFQVFRSKTDRYFDENTSKWDYDFVEYGVPLIDRATGTVTIQKSFADIMYIDAPTVTDILNSPYGNIYADDTFSCLSRMIKEPNPKRQLDDEVTGMFAEVLGGKISVRKDFAQVLLYTSKDGTKQIDISKASSGIKCITALERLYNNGYLDRGTLLIIDEPEVHLHPKWIVDFARIIIALHKHFGVTVLLASHNPDFISAIKYVSNKEGCADNVTFYLSDLVDSTGFGKHNFKNCGRNIEPIFASFNIALDRIDQYGESDDE